MHKYGDQGLLAPQLASFRLDRPFNSLLDPAKKALLLNRLSTFGESATGLGKFTRTMFATDLRRSLLEDDMARAASDA